MKSFTLQLLAAVMAILITASALTGCTQDTVEPPATNLTEVPINPTTVPTDPTDAPNDPTDAPNDSTDAPNDPTDAPTDPTEAPTDPTEEPTNPPATEPPATEPPATEPPAPENDIGKEIAKDEYAITVLAVQQTDNQYTVTFTLTYTGEGAHALSIKERLFVVNSERRSLAADDAFDTEGNSLLGSSIQSGQTITIKAVFTLSEGFEPVSFRYVYDTMGFRRLQAEL